MGKIEDKCEKDAKEKVNRELLGNIVTSSAAPRGYFIGHYSKNIGKCGLTLEGFTPKLRTTDSLKASITPVLKTLYGFGDKTSSLHGTLSL